MAKRVQAKMNTEIALDMMQSQASIKSMTTQVNSFTQSWKASEAQMKSAGDYLGASVAKYEGLGKAIDAQKSKIAKLKEEQGSLKGSTNATAEEFLKYQKQIDQASTRLKSMTAQQSRAKEAMTYQKSGLAGLQKAYALNNKAISAHVERLQADGKTEEAQKAKVKGLESSLANLTSQYKKQRTETIGMARDFGTSSEQYLKAKTRLNETATAMARTKTSANELREAMNKKPAGFMAGVKEKLMSVNSEAKKTSRVGETIKGVFGGSLLTAGVISLTSHLKEVAKSGYESAESATELGEKWKNIGVNDKGVQSLANSAKDLKENTAMSGEAVGNMITKFYGITGSVKGAQQLSKGIGSLSDKLKLSQSQADGFANGLSKIEASGTVTSSSLGRLEKQAPGLSTAMQQASGMSKKAFDSLVDSGKMTSDQFNDILKKASKSYGENSKEFNESSEGAMKHLKQSWADTKQALMKPLVSVAGSGLSSFNKALDNPATQKAVTQLGAGIANLSTKLAGLITIISAHMKDFTSITGSLIKIASIFAKAIWTTIVDVFKDISKAFGNFGLSAKKAQDPIKLLAKALESLASHKKLIQDFAKVMLAIFATSKVTKGILTMTRGIVTLSTSIKAIKTAQTVADLGKLSGATKGFASIKVATKAIKEFSVAEALASAKTKLLSGVTKAYTVVQKGLNLVMKANPLVRAVTIIMAVVSAFSYLYKTNKKFRSWINGLGKDFVKGFSSITKSAKSGVKKVGNFFGSMYKNASKHVSNLWNGTKKGFSKGWNTLSSYSKSGASKVGNWFNHMKTDTSKRAVDMFNAHKKTFKSGYSVLQNYTQTWHDIMTGKWGKVGSDLKNTANSISKFVKNIFSDLYNWLNKLTGGQLGKMVDWWKSKMGSIGDIVASAKASVHKHFVDLVRGVISPFNTLLSGIHKGISWILDKIGSGKLSGEWKIDMPSYATGTKDTHQGGLAQVNDGTGSNYREMYRLPNGQIGMFPAVHNMILPIPKGTSILNGDLSAKYAKMLGIPMYKSGVGDFFSGLWNGAKDVIEDTDKIIKAPEEFMKSVLKHFIGNTSSKISLAQDLITGLPNMVAKNAVKWIKKMFESMANPGGSGVERWRSVIKAVAGQMNFNISEGQVAKLLRQIQTESGGNPTVKQGISDINSREGHPAQGLLQFIPSTFKTWALKGRTNILNGSDQIAAAINALNHGCEGGWGNIGNGHGWANGGIVRNWQYAQIAEHNKPEAVIPLDSAKDSRAWQVLKQVVDIKTAGTSSTATATTTDASNQIAELTNTVKAMANMLNTIIGLNADQVTATKGIVGYDKSRVYRQTATDTSLSGFQALH